MAYMLSAVITNLGRIALAQVQAQGYPFQVKYFSLGMNGCDPEDPTNELTPDTTMTNPTGLVYPVTPITSWYYSDSYTPVFICSIKQGQVVAAISALYLYADAESMPNIYGYQPGQTSTILYAIANFPLDVFTANRAETFSIVPCL